MARGRNHIDTTQVTLSTTPQIVEELEQLVLTGHYGKNPAEAAERLLAAELDRRFGEELMKEAKKSLSSLRQRRKRALRGRK